MFGTTITGSWLEAVAGGRPFGMNQRGKAPVMSSGQPLIILTNYKLLDIGFFRNFAERKAMFKARAMFVSWCNYVNPINRIGNAQQNSNDNNSLPIPNVYVDCAGRTITDEHVCHLNMFPLINEMCSKWQLTPTTNSITKQDLGFVDVDISQPDTWQNWQPKSIESIRHVLRRERMTKNKAFARLYNPHQMNSNSFDLFEDISGLESIDLDNPRANNNNDNNNNNNNDPNVNSINNINNISNINNNSNMDNINNSNNSNHASQNFNSINNRNNNNNNNVMQSESDFKMNISNVSNPNNNKDNAVNSANNNESNNNTNNNDSDFDFDWDKKLTSPKTPTTQELRQKQEKRQRKVDEQMEQQLLEELQHNNPNGKPIFNPLTLNFNW